MIKILHTSDIHGRWDFLVENIDLFEQADIILFTGDMFPEDRKFRFDKKKQELFQVQWFAHSNDVRTITKAIGAKPIIAIDGNHDHASLPKLLKRDTQNVFQPDSYKPVVVNGVSFSGFPNIPYINGCFNHESTDAELQILVSRILRNQPDVLVTHAPPLGIADNGFGIECLGNLVSLTPEQVKFKHHFFGHVHECAGQNQKIGETMFYNGACSVSLHEI